MSNLYTLFSMVCIIVMGYSIGFGPRRNIYLAGISAFLFVAFTVLDLSKNADENSTINNIVLILLVGMLLSFCAVLSAYFVRKYKIIGKDKLEKYRKSRKNSK